MSTRAVSTGTPTASTWTASDPSRVRTMSEVVDHEVQDDVDVQAARGKRAQPVHLDEAWPGHRRLQDVPAGLNRSNVADLENGLPVGGRRE